jgi:hypothetical protein
VVAAAPLVVTLTMTMAMAATPLPAGVPAAALGAPQVIGAPHYGDTLFNFYQDKTFDALVGLMVSQHFARISPHDAEADVLRGGMLLAFGMHQEASVAFTRAINSSTSPNVRDRAWYFLARARQQRGLLAEAQDALSRIEAPLQGPATWVAPGTNAAPSSLEDNRQLLQAQLMLGREDYAGAATVLQALKDSSSVGLVAQFNLGVALVKNGDLAQGQAWLDTVGTTPAADEEQRSVRDRANLALGFAALQDKQPREARAALQRVRLNGMESNRALLAFGWAAMELNDAQLALVPWQTLATRSPPDAAVLEARLAVPYALAEVGATQLALDGYAQAADGFVREQRELADAMRNIRRGTLVQDLLALNPATGGAGGTPLQALPSLPQGAHLAPLLAGNDFQQAYKNLRDLQFLKGNLVQWQDTLGVFAQSLDRRSTALNTTLPALRERAASLQTRRDALAQAVAQAISQEDSRAFANPREALAVQRLQDMQTRLQRIEREAAEAAAVVPNITQNITPNTTQNAAATNVPDDTANKSTDVAALNAADRLRLLSGALTWQLTQALPERSAQATRDLADSQNALAQLRTRDTTLQQTLLQRDEPARQQARQQEFGGRIGSLKQRLSTLMQSLDQMSQANAQQLQALAVAELQSQQERLVVYEGQARLASAQIQDQALFARPPESADKPAAP